MKLQLSPRVPFNLNFTLCCGQALRWVQRSHWWYGVVNKKVVKIRQKGHELEFYNVGTGFITNYFRLQDNLPKILLEINKDKSIKAITRWLNGLRILRQDPWECLISYICATFKTLSGIKRMILNLCKTFGDPLQFNGGTFFTFPTPKKLATVNLQELVECGLGYRARYVSESAKIVLETHLDFNRLKKTSYEEARKILLDFPGVGLKVADCILLFSLEKLDAFPVDTRIKHALLKCYPQYFSHDFVQRTWKNSISTIDYKKLNLFGRNYFGKYAGYAQEYLYHYERTKLKPSIYP